MNIFDIIVFIIVIAAFIRGIIKGFIIELAALLGLILGIVGAVFLSGIVAGWLEGYVAARFVPVLAFILVFAGILVGIHLLARAINSLVKAISLGWLNRILGGFFAVLKAALFVSILLLIIDVFGLSEKIITPHVRNSSYLFNPISRLAPRAFDMFRIGYEHLLPPAKEPKTAKPVLI
ncbi:MAG: CvpA family protein [Cytophagaceae bacterium]|jgi:membrane protein required for colicin V production|nr:CvpA family protein [Cytophagaceae bacterium]